MLLTNSGDQDGSWNGLRPFRIGMATGDVVLDDGTVYVDADTNNVGIGVTSPSTKLHVSGVTTTNKITLT